MRTARTSFHGPLTLLSFSITEYEKHDMTLRAHRTEGLFTINPDVNPVTYPVTPVIISSHSSHYPSSHSRQYPVTPVNIQTLVQLSSSHHSHPPLITQSHQSLHTLTRHYCHNPVMKQSTLQSPVGVHSPLE